MLKSLYCSHFQHPLDAAAACVKTFNFAYFQHPFQESRHCQTAWTAQEVGTVLHRVVTISLDSVILGITVLAKLLKATQLVNIKCLFILICLNFQEFTVYVLVFYFKHCYLVGISIFFICVLKTMLKKISLNSFRCWMLNFEVLLVVERHHKFDNIRSGMKFSNYWYEDICKAYEIKFCFR